MTSHPRIHTSIDPSIVLLTYPSIRPLAIFPLFWLGSTTDKKSHTPKVLEYAQDVRQGEKKDLEARSRSTLLSALRLDSAANGHNDKDKEIKYLVCSR